MKKFNTFFRGITFLCCLFAVTAYGQNFPGAGSPDTIERCNNGGTQYQINVSGVDNTFSVETVSVNITHTWNDDLEISLISPSGATILLSSDNGGSGDNYNDVIFDDGAADPISSLDFVTGTISGPYSPEEPLATFNAANGVNPNGIWTLSICDDAAGDIGNLNSWELNFAFVPPPPPTCDDGIQNGDEQGVDCGGSNCPTCEYCDATSGSGDGTGIILVNVGSSSYPISMPGPDGFYQDVTGSPAALQQGLEGSLSIDYGHTFSYFTFAWIDFNDDFNFDANELVSDGNSSGGSAPHNITLGIDVPAGANLGVHRMRIVGSDFGSTADPCRTGSFQAVVDLDVEIIEPLCSPATIGDTTIVDRCDDQQFEVSIDILTGGDAESITDGTTVWPIGDTGINTVGPFASGETVSLTVVHSDEECNINLGDFVLNCPPVNDNCIDAIALGCGAFVEGTTEFANNDPSLADCDNLSVDAGNGVWYSYLGTGGDIVLDTSGSDFDTKLAVFSGDCNALVCIASDDDGGTGVDSQLTFTSELGVNYLIYVTGFSSFSSGDYVLTLDCICDVYIEQGECVKVFSGYEPTSSVELTAVGQFGEAPYSYEWSDGQTTATATFTPTEQTTYIVTVTDATGCTSTASTTVIFENVVCNDNPNNIKVNVCHNGDQICVSPNAVQAHLNHGDTLGACDVVVDCSTAPLCDARLKVPQPDAIDVATDIEISWGAATGFVEGYILSVGTTSGGTDIIDNQDVGNTLSFNLTDLDFLTTYYVTIIPYNSNGQATGCEASSSFTTEAGPWCDGATVECSVPFSGNTATDGVQNDVDTCGTSLTSAPGVWHTFVGNGDEIVASLCDSNFDTKIGVFTGDCTGITCVVGTDDGGPCGVQSEVEFQSTAGVTYYIYVTGFSTSTGDYTLELTCTPPPPPLATCVAATGIECGASVNGNTALDGELNDLDFCGTSITSAPGVFYKFEGNGDNVSVDTFGSSFDTKLAVFSGDCGNGGNNLVCVGGNDDSSGSSQSQVNFASESGVLYYIYVTGFGSNAGNYTLNLNCVSPPGGEVDCGTVLAQEYCYGNNETTGILYTSSNGSPLELVFNSGRIEASIWDFLTIYDGTDATGTVVYQNGTTYGYDLSGDTITAASGSMFLLIESDSSVSCASGSSFATNWVYEVSCAAGREASTTVPTWNLYPNPSTTGEVQLDLSNYLNQDVSIQMTDFSGKVMVNNNESNLQSPRYSLSTQGMSYGIYFVRVATNSGVSTKKLIIANK